MPAVDEILIRMKAVGGGAAAAEIGGAERAIGGLGRAAKGAAGIAGVGALGLGLKDVVNHSLNFSTTQGQLQNSLRNMGEGGAKNIGKFTDAADTLATQGGFDPTTQIQGYTLLTQAHVKVGEALKDNLLINDIARAKNVSYTTAAKAVANAEQGRTTGLGRLQVVVPKVTAAQDALAKSTTHATVEQRAHAKELDASATKVNTMRELWRRFGGSVEDFNKKPQGAISNFKNSIEILQTKLGKELLPAITWVVRKLTDLVNWLPKAAAWIGRAFDTVKNSDIGKWVANAVGNIVTAVGAGIDWIVHAWQTIEPVVVGVFNTIVGILGPVIGRIITIIGGIIKVVSAVVGWIVAHWKWALLLLGPLLPVFALIFGIFRRLVTVVVENFGHIRDFIVGVFNRVKGAVSDAVGWIVRAFNNVVGFLRPIVQGIWNVVTWPFREVIRIATGIWNAIKGPLGQIAGFLKPVFAAVLKVLTDPFNLAIGAAKLLWSWIQKVYGPLKDIYNMFFGSGSTLPAKSQAAIQQAGGPKGHGGAPGTGSFTPFGKQAGGFVPHGGWYDVGERGKERVFLPGGSTVAPNSFFRGGGGGGEYTIHSYLVVDSQVVARATNRGNLARAAVS